MRLLLLLRGWRAVARNGGVCVCWGALEAVQGGEWVEDGGMGGGGACLGASEAGAGRLLWVPTLVSLLARVLHRAAAVGRPCVCGELRRAHRPEGVTGVWSSGIVKTGDVRAVHRCHCRRWTLASCEQRLRDVANNPSMTATQAVRTSGYLHQMVHSRVSDHFLDTAIDFCHRLDDSETNIEDLMAFGSSAPV